MRMSTSTVYDFQVEDLDGEDGRGERSELWLTFIPCKAMLSISIFIEEKFC